MDDAVRVEVLEGLADLGPDAQHLGDGEAVALRPGEELVYRAPRHVLADDVGLPGLLADIVDRHDVGVLAEPPHRAGFAADPRESRLVEPFGLDEGESDVPFEPGIVYEVDALLPALAQQGLYAVPPRSEGGGKGCSQSVTRRRRRRRERGRTSCAESCVGTLRVAAGRALDARLPARAR